MDRSPVDSSALARRRSGLCASFLRLAAILAPRPRYRHPWLFAAAVAVAAPPLAGCRDDTGIEEVTVSQLAERLEAPSPPAVFDANGAKVREDYGVIAGATLLPSASDYALSQLPDSKTQGVVFYCSSTWCSAAKTAALRARDAGYSDVSVLAVGIKGWQSAGRPTVPASEARTAQAADG